MLVKLSCGCIHETIAMATDFWSENVPPDTYWESVAGLRHCIKCREIVDGNPDKAVKSIQSVRPFTVAMVGQGITRPLEPLCYAPGSVAVDKGVTVKVYELVNNEEYRWKDEIIQLCAGDTFHGGAINSPWPASRDYSVVRNHKRIWFEREEVECNPDRFRQLYKANR